MSSLNLTHSIPEPTLSQAEARSNHLTNQGFFFHQSRDYAKALDLYQQAQTINPKNARSYYLTGQIHQLHQDYPHAIQSYEHALIAKPNFLSPIASLAKLALETFDWSLFQDSLNQLPSKLPPHSISSDMYQLLLTHQPDVFDHLQVQKNWDDLVAYQTKPHQEFFNQPINSPPKKSRIRLCYLTSQAYLNPTGRQLLKLVHSHNPDLFHTYIIATNALTGDTLENKLQESTHDFISKPHADIAMLTSLIRHQHIDVLVHLDEHIHLNAAGALALQAAPIQLIYPGILFPQFSQHITSTISDSVLKIPSPTQVLKPSWFLTTPLPKNPVDTNNSLIPPKSVGLVSLVSLDHIHPKTLDLWLQIIQTHPQTTLLLPFTHPHTQSQMTAKLEQFNLDLSRVVFMPPTQHAHQNMTYLSQADIYLESTYLNHHHSAALALNQSLPVICQLGSSPQTRTTASLLKAAKLTSLIAKNPKGYLKIASDLINQPKKLAHLKGQLGQKKFPCFDSSSTLTGYEQFLQQLFQKSQSN